MNGLLGDLGMLALIIAAFTGLLIIADAVASLVSRAVYTECENCGEQKIGHGRFCVDCEVPEVLW